MKWIHPTFLALCIFTAGCSHQSAEKTASPKKNNPLPADYLSSKGALQITSSGDNDHPRFSKNGKKLIYSSRLRKSHSGSQIYEFDLENNHERRITFSDGDAFEPVYLDDDEILYSSTTDEIKEQPLRNKVINKDFPPSDLYMSDLYGTEISRLTHQPGYDGQGVHATSPSQKSSILFTSRRGELTGIYRLDMKTRSVSLVSAECKKEKLFPSLSADGKHLVWLERDLKSGQQSLMQLKLGEKKSQTLKLDEGEFDDLFYAPRPPARLFYSVRRNGEQHSHIETYDIEKNCTQVVLKGPHSLSSPTTSNEINELLTLSREINGSKQIYTLPLPSDLEPCLETSGQANLKE